VFGVTQKSELTEIACFAPLPTAGIWSLKSSPEWKLRDILEKVLTRESAHSFFKYSNFLALQVRLLGLQVSFELPKI
jgi:hypothetical protein